ncbi:MAG: STAS domain-containing protein [Pirellulales bacterium]
MLETATHWQLDVDRGPDWVFVRIMPPNAGVNPDADGLAEMIWDVLRSNFCYRLVLEMDRVELLYSSLIGQLILLGKRVHSHEGVLRISGLSASNQHVVEMCRLEAALPCYPNRNDAVMGHLPNHPR